MGYYLRKSVKLGPIRLNFSKSGIGASVGVPGLRYGVRPNGRTYVHAGRYGIYYREEFGTKVPKASVDTPPTSPSVAFDALAASDLPRTSQTDLLRLLNESYNWPRVDYLAGAITIAAAALGLASHVSVAGVLAAIGTISTLRLASWEKRRRTVYLNYPLDGAVFRAFQRIIGGFNALASCSGIWSIISAVRLTTLKEFKWNAGAAHLVDRKVVSIGEGTPPWCEINIPVPTLQTRGQTFYFLPDGILLYDASGIAHIDYGSLKIATRESRFIESVAPSDATVVDYTWLHPNKDGGPDRRFGSNHELPVCLYGEAVVATGAGLCLYLQCSQVKAVSEFRSAMHVASEEPLPALRRSADADNPWVAVNMERYQSLNFVIADAIKRLWAVGPRSVRFVDGILRRIAGEDNDIIHQFLRILTLAAR